jgi:hypothetical protein
VTIYHGWQRNQLSSFANSRITMIPQFRGLKDKSAKVQFLIDLPQINCMRKIALRQMCDPRTASVPLALQLKQKTTAAFLIRSRSNNAILV